MTDTITVTGVVGSDPRVHVTSQGLTITSFRLASTRRYFDRTKGAWEDGETNWYTVSGFRQLAHNAATSVHRGDRVVVHGRLRLRAWENGEKSGTAIEIEADSIGHDLAWGTTVLTSRAGPSASARACRRDRRAPRPRSRPSRHADRARSGAVASSRGESAPERCAQIARAVPPGIGGRTATGAMDGRHPGGVADGSRSSRAPRRRSSRDVRDASRADRATARPAEAPAPDARSATSAADNLAYFDR